MLSRVSSTQDIDRLLAYTSNNVKRILMDIGREISKVEEREKFSEIQKGSRQKTIRSVIIMFQMKLTELPKL
ncbi:Uncharacterised protein [Fusobacterium necrophorum subsp. necrophorum]|nr:Uncharacterised protein [Fusobacterium necrophorum subsp. necrophorum]